MTHRKNKRNVGKRHSLQTQMIDSSGTTVYNYDVRGLFLSVTYQTSERGSCIVNKTRALSPLCFAVQHNNKF